MAGLLVVADHVHIEFINLMFSEEKFSNTALVFSSLINSLNCLMTWSADVKEINFISLKISVNVLSCFPMILSRGDKISNGGIDEIA